MSIKTTQTISRDNAIDRISFIVNSIKTNNVDNINKYTYENDYSPFQISEFMYHDFPLKWLKYLPNEELEDLMDRPFVRYSMFENYVIGENN